MFRILPILDCISKWKSFHGVVILSKHHFKLLILALSFSFKELQTSFGFGFLIMAIPVPIPKPHFKLGQFQVLVP
jgi:hypothetical protein